MVDDTTLRRLLIAGVVVGLVVGAVVAVIVLRTRATGRIVVIDVKAYVDSACTIELTEIQWGDISPSQTAVSTIYIKNIQNQPVILSLDTENYNPLNVQQYLITSWDIPSNYILQPNIVRKTNISLSVSAEVKETIPFSYDIVIKATPTE